MHKYRVTGGSNLDIKGCYGVKNFLAYSEEELRNRVKNDIEKIKSAKLIFGDNYWRNKNIIYTLCRIDGNKWVAFEFYYELLW